MTSPGLTAYSQEADFYAGCKWLCSAPIALAGSVLGVIDVGFIDDYDFLVAQSRLETLLQIVGQNIGVYEYLLAQFRIQAELQRTHLLTYANVSHQIKSPLRVAVGRADWVCKDLNDETKSLDAIALNAARVKGLCNKAYRVAKSMELHAKISQGTPITCNLRRYSPSVIGKLVYEALSDTKFLMGRAAEVEFSLDQRQIQVPGVQVLADLNHYEQALDAVVNNAFKYSYPKSEIRAKFILWGKYLTLEIKNQGIPLDRDAALNCADPGWRSEAAKNVDQDGSGLGCWLAAKLMKIMKGRFEAIPTDEKGETTFNLVLSLTSGHSGH